MSGNKGPTQMLVNQTTSDKENVVEHPSTLQLDQDIQELTMGGGGRLELLKSKIGNKTNKEELPSNQQATLETWAASQIWLYHKRLKHPLFGLLKTMFPHLFTKESVKSFKYDVCQFSKHHRATFSPSNNKSLEPFDLIHSDFSKFLKDNGVVHELTCVNTPQQSRVAERKNCHLLEIARAFLFQMFIPNVYWREVVLTVTYLINRLPTWVLNDINPTKHMVSFFPSSPLMLSLPSRVFWCVVFVHSHNPHRGKLDHKVVKCIFIGYSSNKKGGELSKSRTCHRVIPFPTEDVQIQVQEVTKLTLVLKKFQMFELDVSIIDNSIKEQVQLSEPKVSIPDNSIEDVTDDMPIALRKGKQSCAKYLISQFVCTNHLSIQHQSFIVVIDAIKTPTSVQEALKDENWVQAMKEEMKALKKNSTWEIVNRPKDKRVCKSIGTLERYKARLVAKGYTQTYGIDYEETSSPVVKMNMRPRRSIHEDSPRILFS
ncbi:hypothetical protein CR513_21093, partial [Mucuna pruriens]